MKLKATVFMLYFPITFTLAIVNVWIKIIPNPNMMRESGEDYTKEEIEGMTAAKLAIKEFVHGLLGHIKSLTAYLQQVIDEKPLQTNYDLICDNPDFIKFKEVFCNYNTNQKSGHTGITNVDGEMKF
jgi:hypothetical protein